MDRLMQLVLIAAIATSSYSYSLQRNEPDIPKIPQESDDYYPTEYIEKLVDALSPEELQRFRSIIELQHRDSIPSSLRCSWYTHSKIRAKDETGTEYFIVDVENLKSIPIQTCNYTEAYQCRKDYSYYGSSTRTNCCVGVLEKRTLIVVSVADYYEYRANRHFVSYITSRDLYIKTRCECTNIALDAMDLNNNEDTCLHLALQ